MQQKLDLEILLDQNMEDEMGDVRNHIKHLKESHRVLDLKISEMEAHPHVDEEHLHELKKQKLRLKDEITRFESQANDKQRS